MMETGSFKEFSENEEIREVLAVPRNIPRKIREEIAEIIFHEMILGDNYEIRDHRKFVERYGAFYLLFSTMKSSDEWPRIKDIAKSSDIAATYILRDIVEKILDILDETGLYLESMKKGLPENMSLLMAEFERIMEDTRKLWDRKVHKNAAPGYEDEYFEPPVDQVLAERIDLFLNEENSRKFLIHITRQLLLERFMQSVRNAEEHLRSIELMTLLYPGRGWDHSMIELHRKYFSEIHKYSRIFERNEDLKKILRLLGKIEMEHGFRMSGISSHSRSEVYSISMSKNLEYLLPAELIKLQDNTLRTLFFANMLEGRLLTYQLRGKDQSRKSRSKKRKGPVITLVDTSGSMHGAPEIVAKSVILAIVKNMLKEKRDVKVFLFSSVDQTIEIEMTDIKKMATEFLDFLSYTFEGGTDFNTALKAGLTSLREKKFRSADLLFITDGLSDITDTSLIREYNILKEQYDTRIFTLITGNNDAGGLKMVSDHIFLLDREDSWDPDDNPAKLIKIMTRE
ncbi:hypothetical protein CUJ83_11955 [Methanocella sp. CWC-04]|uniref:VWFA domain-containing protein n=1 Tax=Methanooceanicella nereidis TaxID=2052831 RepID=A0AAP2RGA3_9EURY|nr:VWA domain-containing protein [Methanocella sp. CWC-04]MCD1295712.1 hypothetical protein [Methanocella sp. CWC-04]